MIVEIGDVSSGFLQYVAMAFRSDQGSQVYTVIATGWALMRPRTQIRYTVGCIYHPVTIC